jgi:RNA polymerase sigma-70 factor (ECF subfamily)
MDDKRDRFEAQVMPHLDAAYRFAHWLAGGQTEADDVVQEAFLRAYRAFDSLRGGDVKAWLFTIVRNCHATERRQSGRRTFVPLPAESEPQPEQVICAAAGPEAATIMRDEQRSLERLLAQLPQEQREVLVLRELEEMSYSEIAGVTGAPIGTVMSRLARARAALRDCWTRSTQADARALR